MAKIKQTTSDNWAHKLKPMKRIVVPDHRGKIPLRINSTTTIMVDPDADMQAIINKYSKQNP